MKLQEKALGEERKKGGNVWGSWKKKLNTMRCQYTDTSVGKTGDQKTTQLPRREWGDVTRFRGPGGGGAKREKKKKNGVRRPQRQPSERGRNIYRRSLIPYLPPRRWKNNWRGGKGGDLQKVRGAANNRREVKGNRANP